MRNDLKKARQERGLTQQELAAKLGKDQTAISRYESGRRLVDAKIAPKLAKLLGLTVVHVLYGPRAAST